MQAIVLSRVPIGPGRRIATVLEVDEPLETVDAEGVEITEIRALPGLRAFPERPQLKLLAGGRR